MGKPFASEINQLEKTYKWALSADTSESSNVIKDTCGIPLISVGSGGSFSAAEFQAFLHRKFFGSIGHASTPLELIAALPRNREAAVWFMSASGNNIDIYRAFQHTALNEMRSVNAIVGRKNSKVHQLSRKYEYTNLFEFPIPSGKDGFLATNSLLAFFVILYKSYCEASSTEIDMPRSLDGLLEKTIVSPNLKGLQKSVAPIWKKKAVHIIYSSELKSAALDIESKFVEAGLISCHLADMRNFAHGRHHWFSKHSDDSGIIALSSENDFDLAERTLNLLPKSIPKNHISFKSRNGAEVISGLVVSMYFTQWLGIEKGIDPGRPGVPPYGSKIYRLTANSGFTSSIEKKHAAIARKRKFAPQSYDILSEHDWSNAYNQFTKKLANSDIGGLVLDYDGTIVDSNKRWDPPTPKMVEELIRLLESKVVIGFATGRGKSIRKDLQAVIPNKFWKDITIGYYNGAEIKSLSENGTLEGADKPIVEIKTLYQKLENNIFLTNLADFDQNKKQLTVKRKKDKALSETFLWDLVQDEFCQDADHKGKVLRSSHSIDVIAENVCKLSVVEAIKATIGHKKEILTIGDRGKWPGNDSALLKEKLSLSVDEVSYSSSTCWNLCPAGMKCSQGTLYYFSRLQKKNNRIRFIM